MSNAPKKKLSLPKPPVPRSQAEIEKEYSKTMSDLATASYLKYVYEVNIETFNKNLVGLNQELKARQELDKGASNESQQS